MDTPLIVDPELVALKKRNIYIYNIQYTYIAPYYLLPIPSSPRHKEIQTSLLNVAIPSSVVVLTPPSVQDLPEHDLDVVPLALPVQVDRLHGVHGEVVELPPVLRAGPVRSLGLQSIVQQVDVLGVSVLRGPHGVTLVVLGPVGPVAPGLLPEYRLLPGLALW